MTTSHSFNIDIAEELQSAELAILLHHFIYWIEFNARADKNFYEGCYWMYQTTESIANHFPYWSKDKIKRLIQRLVDKKILKKSNYNKTKFDRTVWYTVDIKYLNTKRRNRQMENTESSNGKDIIAPPIPDTKTDTETKRKETKRKGEKEYMSDASIGLANFLLSEIKKHHPGFKNPNLQKWAVSIGEMLVTDKRKEEDIKKVIAWSQQDKFWKTNILSGNKLRIQFDKLHITMNSVLESPKEKEKKEAKKKVDRSFENRKLAEKFLKDKKFPSFNKTITLGDACVFVKTPKGMYNLSYLEHGFKDQLESAYRKLA